MAIIPIDRTDEQIAAGREALASVRQEILALRAAARASDGGSPGYGIAVFQALFVIQRQLAFLDRYLTDRPDDRINMHDAKRIHAAFEAGTTCEVVLSDGGQSRLWLGSPFDETTLPIWLDANSARRVRDRWLGITAQQPEAPFTFPERIVVDEASFDKLSDRVANPREPNEAVKALFKPTDPTDKGDE